MRWPACVLRALLFGVLCATTGIALACANDADSTPSGSRAFDEREISLTTDDSVQLAGTFAMPRVERGARLPAVVLVSGSGAQDRSGTRNELPGYQPLADLAHALARNGIAVIRLDDRGAGRSGGSAFGTTTTRSARDIASAVQWLRGLSIVDGSRIGLVGHSEGGLVAMIVASQDTTIRTLVLLATPSRPGREVARWQRDWLTASDLAQYPTERRQQMLADAEQSAERQAANDPWMREWFSLDPRLIARQLRGDALIVHGERDRQVPVEQSAELAGALRDSGVRVDVVRVPGVNHLLLEDADGDPRLYVRIVERRISRALLERIALWLAQRS